MRADEAPPPGWYPDPEGGSRLRWWEGTDWSDRFRAPPTASEYDRRELVSATHGEDLPEAAIQTDDPYRRLQAGGLNRQDSQAIIDQVRIAAREEANRAAEMFGTQARSVTMGLQPLITEYTSKVVRWFRIISSIAIVLIIGWLLFQLFAQVSLFNWLGDRIDNVTDNTGSIVSLSAGVMR